MATVDSISPLAVETLYLPSERLLTIADLDVFPTELPSGPVDYELDNGRLVCISVLHEYVHSTAQSNIGTQLKVQGDMKGHGKARTSVGVILWRNPDRVVSPDVLFVANKSLPIKRSREGYLETIPELVVEVRSKNDSKKYLERKIAHYLQAGVEVVWLVDPATKTVAVHTATGDAQIRREGESLELPGMIPEFSMLVAEVFRE